MTIDAHKYTYSSYSNVKVHMPPMDYKSIVGMCGNFDGNSGNDQQKPNGQNVGGSGTPAFTESWKYVQSNNAFQLK